jgi:hypothetical protein
VPEITWWRMNKKDQLNYERDEVQKVGLFREANNVDIIVLSTYSI